MFFEFLHIANKLLMLLKVHFVVFHGNVTMRFEETLGKFEVFLLNLLYFSLADN